MATTLWQVMNVLQGCNVLFRLVIICVSALAAWVAAEPLAGGGAATPPVIGMVLHGLERPVYQRLEEHAQRYCRSGEGYCRVSSGGPLGSKEVDTQKQWLKQLLAEKVDAVVIAPISRRELIPQLMEAKNRGVKIVNIGTRLDSELLTRNRLIIPWVGPDNGAAARSAAQLLVDRLGAGKSVAILSGVPGESASFDRVVAAKGVLSKGGVKVVAVEAAEWDADLAQKKTQMLLETYRDLAGIFSVNDDMAIGALRAADLRNHKLLITGFGGDQPALELVRAGRLLATVDWYPDRQGVYAIEKLLSGMPGDKKTPWRLLTRDDL